MNIPSELRYTKDHEWVRVEDNFAYVGITDFAQSELGELVYVEVDTLGDEVSEGDVFGTVEAVKTTSDLFMPIDGKVLEFNDELNEDEVDNPGAINEDPYGKGWIVKILITNKDQIEGLLTSEAYAELIS